MRDSNLGRDCQNLTDVDAGEWYDALHDRWQEIPDMITPRSNFAVDVVENSLMVIGGFNGKPCSNIYHDSLLIK
ncbi:KLHL10 [Cordylochernes scorpioides]|uniref:KLHL10 n=1 Tax=Cordylochernes scorpioides TaxID=51811 RepID=A0ABY6JY58_9ARAC|nr:KLHL10 [Cordylochernes scorpioides]